MDPPRRQRRFPSRASLAANATGAAPQAANGAAVKSSGDAVYRDVSAASRGRGGRILGVRFGRRFGRMAQIPPPRAALAALVIAVVVTGAIAARIGARSCARGGSQCSAGIIRWSRRLPGTWIAQNGVDGTTLSQGQAYAAAGGGVAVIGFGTTGRAYDLATGFPRWTQTLTGVTAG